MRTFDVFVKTRHGGRQDVGLTVDGNNMLAARDVAAEILHVPADIVLLEVAA